MTDIMQWIYSKKRLRSAIPMKQAHPYRKFHHKHVELCRLRSTSPTVLVSHDKLALATLRFGPQMPSNAI